MLFCCQLINHTSYNSTQIQVNAIFFLNIKFWHLFVARLHNPCSSINLFFQDATFAMVVSHVLVAVCHNVNVTAIAVTMNAMEVCQFLSA